jgi:hypothetical protein
MVTIYLWWGAKVAYFFLCWQIQLAMQRPFVSQSGYNYCLCVHGLVVRNHVGIYVHVATSVFMSQFMGLLDSTQGQTWGNKNINESTFVALEKCEEMSNKCKLN